jgi:hypothetical protein
MQKESGNNSEAQDTEDLSAIDTVEKEINAFAAKLGEETGNNYTVYVYRVVTDEDSGRKKKPFCKKYVGVEPDPSEIAERFRGGTYLVQFIWYCKKSQKSKAYTLDVDKDAFPPVPKTPAGVLGNQIVSSNLSEQMQLQMMTINSITEVLKAAYTNGNNRPESRADPLEQFAGVMEVMEGSFTRAMQLNQKVMERVYLKSMEKKYGLEDGEIVQHEQPLQSTDDGGIIGKYAPMIKMVVDGISQLFAMFGDKGIPKQVVEKVRADDRFRALLSDPKALVVIGQALKKEFGTDKANAIMKMFGVKMIPKPVQPVNITPPVPVVDANTAKTADSSGNGSVLDKGSSRSGGSKKSEKRALVPTR